jgi:hypothetical protein
LGLDKTNIKGERYKQIMSFTEKQYKEYSKYNFFMANPDIFNGAKAHIDLKEWISKENISSDVINEMNKRMEVECDSEHSELDLLILNDIEYISLMVMLGRMSSEQIISYMKLNDLDKLTLTNGIVIEKDRIGTYVATFKNDGGLDSIELRLFLLLNKKNNEQTYSIIRNDKEI